MTIKKINGNTVENTSVQNEEEDAIIQEINDIIDAHQTIPFL